MARLTALPSEGGSWTALLEREDIVLIGGMLHLRHDDTTPEQARIADLLLIADSLSDAGIPHLLIRHSGSVPGLVVDLVHRSRALTALADQAVTEPLYAKAKGGTPVPFGELRLRASGPASVRVFRPRIAGELRACGVDFSFTPVLDLDYGRSGVIGDRAFHRNPNAVAHLAAALVDGLRSGGMAAVGKHFPGHGYAEADSHTDLPVDDRPLHVLEADDLVPFGALIGRGWSWMVAVPVVVIAALGLCGLIRRPRNSAAIGR
jgi:hypothetical protein